MSTEGCVAVKREDGWIGVYSAHDSYPSVLGESLWYCLSELEKQDKLNEFPLRLLAFGTWDDYVLANGDPLMSEGGSHITNKDDLSFLNWIYIVDVEQKKVEVLYPIFKNRRFEWKKIGEFIILEKPDFLALERRADAIDQM